MIITECKLKINSSEYEVFRFTYHFQRDTDSKNQPCSVYYGGDLFVEIRSVEDGHIFEQMVHPKMLTVDGAIEVFSGNDGICFRRIEFQKAYICSYNESVDCTSYHPMSTILRISPMMLRIDSLSLDRRWPQTTGSWTRVEKEERIVTHAPEMTPVSVTDTNGPDMALMNTEIKYKATGYSSGVSDSDRKRVRWLIKVDGRPEDSRQQGEVLKLTVKPSWAGKEITAMPYLDEPDSRVYVRTKVVRFKESFLFATSMRKPGKTMDGSATAEDMKYGDVTPEELLEKDRSCADLLNTDDRRLFANMYALARSGSLWEGQDNALAIVRHFEENTGQMYSSSYMNERLKEHETFKEFVYNNDDNGVLKILCKNLHVKNGNINELKLLTGEIRSTSVKFNTKKDLFNGMTISVDGSMAYRVYVDDYELNSGDTFSCKLRIHIFDHYGLDWEDVRKVGNYHPGFKSWYILQHVRGYKPFLTCMEAIVPIENQKF